MNSNHSNNQDGSYHIRVNPIKKPKPIPKPEEKPKETKKEERRRR